MAPSPSTTSASRRRYGSDTPVVLTQETISEAVSREAPLRSKSRCKTHPTLTLLCTRCGAVSTDAARSSRLRCCCRSGPTLFLRPELLSRAPWSLRRLQRCSCLAVRSRSRWGHALTSTVAVRGGVPPYTQVLPSVGTTSTKRRGASSSLEAFHDPLSP